MNQLPFWVICLQALATPVIAFAGLWIAKSNHKLAAQKREDDLFDRRFALLTRVREFQRHVMYETSSDSLLRDIDDLVTSAKFLFGDTFASRLKKILNNTGEMAPFDSDPEVSQLFISQMNSGAK